MSTSRYDILREQHFEELEDMEREAYYDLCEDGYEGTFEDFRREFTKSVSKEPPKVVEEIGDDDISF